MIGYPVGLVGETNYQPAIKASSIADAVEILHEIGNPHDERALVVKNASGEKIGYIARDCWLQRAIHDESRSCVAVIWSMNEGPHGLGVVVEVLLEDEEVKTCAYRP